jgi:serine/threonine protein kinase
MIEGKFLLRCSRCSLTQPQNVYLNVNWRSPLECQNPTCGGHVNIILYSQPKTIQEIVEIQSPSPVKPTLKSGDIIPPKQILREIKPPTEVHSFIQRAGAPKIKDHQGIKKGDIMEADGEFYEVIEKIGTGGMGAVHKVQNIKTKQIAAMKEFFYNRFHDPETGENKCENYWDREQQLTQIQSHSPELCMHFFGALKMQLFQIAEYYIFLEFIEGKPLYKWYTERYKKMQDLTLSELRFFLERLILPICKHIYYVHQQGIVHRDLTVQNIMIIENQSGIFPIVIDWGVAKYIGLERMYNPPKPYFKSNVPEGTRIHNRGTPPEVMAGFEPKSATDIYMLGHVMYYLFTGGDYSPTAAKSEDFVLHPNELNPSLPPAYNKIVEYMTQYEPADRMENMVKVYYAVQELLTNSKESNVAKPIENIYLHCEYNQCFIPLPPNQIVRLGRDEIIKAGTIHDYDGHFYDAFIPNEKDQFQMELYLDHDMLYLQDIYSKLGTIINNLTMPNQQVYNNIQAKGLKNCYIPLSEVNVKNVLIEIPYNAPEGDSYSIPFRIIKK